jgi:hypothetical protein
MGIGSLVREAHVVLIAVLALAISLLPWGKAGRLRYLSVMSVAVLIAALALLPWVVRGYSLTGTLVFPTSSGGWNLYATACLSSEGAYKGDLRDLVSKKIAPRHQAVIAAEGIQELGGSFLSSDYWTFKSIDDEVRADTLLRKKTMEAFRENPGLFLRQIARGALAVWFGGWTERMGTVAKLLNAPVLLLGMVGFLAAVRRGQKEAWLLLVAVIVLNFVYSLGASQVRYSLPTMPAVLLLAARGFTALTALHKPTRAG